MENLHKNIELHNVNTVYQPIYSIDSDCYICFEALTRIYNAAGINYPIQEAISFAEEHDLIDSIFDILMENIIREFAFCKKCHISINISPVQLLSEENSRRILRTIINSGIPLEKIICEITESKDVKLTPQFYRNVRFLQSSGLKIAIDDFDVGLSTKYMIDGMRPDIVKLDRNFIYKHIDENDFLIELVKRLNSFGCRVIAEGVETKLQEEQLAKCGIKEFQGFLYSKPMCSSSFR